MAVTPDQSSRAFVREVDDELRREQVADFWFRHGTQVIVAVVALLVLVGAGLWWHHHREVERGVEGEHLQAAFDKLGSGDVGGAGAGLAPIAADGGPGYRSLARMAQGDVALRRGDASAAARLFAQVAADEKVGEPLRNLALVRQTAAEFDRLRPEVVVARLRRLAVAGNPFFGSAGEMVGVAYLRSGRRPLAATLFGQIANDDTVPASVRQRAVQMASVLGTGPAARAQDKPAA